MTNVVFFADVLGFSALSVSDAGSAERALDDVALLFSDQDEITRLLQKENPWTARYGLSDSIFLVADDDAAAAAAAARFFFHLAYLNASVPARVLVRGALVRGEVRKRGPIFAESATGNVVGEAVVKATMLEKSGAKGPRLLLDDAVAAKLTGSSIEWLLDDSEGPKELLWLLPPDPEDLDVSHLRPVVEAAADAFLNAPEAVAEHYVAYIDLVLRALARLRTVDRDMAAALVRPSTPARSPIASTNSSRDASHSNNVRFGVSAILLRKTVENAEPCRLNLCRFTIIAAQVGLSYRHNGATLRRSSASDTQVRKIR